MNVCMYEFIQVCTEDHVLHVLANRVTLGKIPISLCSVFLIYKVGMVMIVVGWGG